MKNAVKVIIAVLLLTSVLVSVIGCGTTKNTKAQQCAVKFVENMYDGKAQAWVDLILDSLLAQDMIAEGYATEELYVYAVGKDLDDLIAAQKSEYGKRWKYKVSVIDSYSVEPPKEFSECELVEVCLKIEHSGRKLLFFKVSDTEEFKIQVIKKDNDWYVFRWSNTIF